MPTEQDYEKESAECLRRIAEMEKRIEEIKADIKDKPDPRALEMKELKETCKNLLTQAKQLARHGERNAISQTVA